MYSPPYIFFHSGTGFNWNDGVDPILQKLQSLNDAPRDLLPSLTINVSQPGALMTWLRTNNAALITNLSIYVDPVVSGSPSPQQWCRLFDQLQHDATNLQALTVYWDAEGPWGTPKPWSLGDIIMHPGLGRSVVFIRGLAQLKEKESVEMGGFYAKHWPKYLEEKVGLKPVEDISTGYRERALRDYQHYTERLNPWVETEDRRV
ncbi:hypothetical protein MMC07_008676 [Pseudocyphellaria aurata]|nr:hypothetical protein [Pseudocyphellaria aurata]